MRRFRIPLVLAIIMVVLLVLAACGGADDENDGGDQPDYAATQASLELTQVALDALQPEGTEPPRLGESIDYASLQSGDLVYYTDFDGPGDWEEGWLQLPIPSENEGYEVYLDGLSNMYFDITDPNTDVIAWPNSDIVYFPRDYADALVEATVYNVGKNTINNISVMCRFSDEGFYMFSLMSGGKWYIWKFTAGKGFKQLTNGGLQNFDYYSPHVIAGTCIGEELTLYVDGEQPKNAQITERTFLEGGVGLGVYSGNGNVQVEIEDFTVSIP